MNPESPPVSEMLNSGVTVTPAFLRTKYFKTSLALVRECEGRFWLAKDPGEADPKAYSNRLEAVALLPLVANQDE